MRLTRNVLDFKGEQLVLVMEDLIREGFQPYFTSVGGSGLGILSQYPEHRIRESHTRHAPEDLGQMTPPDTPMPRSDSPVSSSSQLEPLRSSFASTELTKIPEWATDLGRWLYV